MKFKRLLVLSLTSLVILSGCKSEKIDDAKAEEILEKVNFDEAFEILIN